MKRRFLYDHGVNAEVGGSVLSDGKQAGEARKLTFGERLAGVTFNPSKSPSVDEVKHGAAAFMDRIDEAQHRMTEMESIQHVMFEQSKILALQAQMLAVKAITWNG